MKNQNDEVLKSILPDELVMLTQTVSTGIEDIIYWPIPQSDLLSLYSVSSEHSRSIQIKAECCFGEGIIGKSAERFEDLCSSGSADIFVQLGVDLECFGNAFMQVVRSGNRIIGLSRLPAITMYRNANMLDFVQVAILPDGQEQITHFNANEIVHFRLPCPYGSYYALPSWIGSGGMLELVKSAVTWNKKFFENGAMPEYAVITKGTPLGTAQKNATKEFFQQNYKGVDNSHRTLVLHIPNSESEIEFKSLSQNIKDGDFLKLLDAAKEKIHIAHGVPPRMLGIISAGQLGGGGEVTGQLFIFEKLTLAPRRRRMRDLLRPLLKELKIKLKDIEFKGIDLTPPDQDNTNINSWTQSGIISTDEARSLLQINEKHGIEKSMLELLNRL